MNEDGERLVRIETKIDYILGNVSDLEARVRLLERWQYAIPASIITALASAVTTIVIALGR